MKLRGVLLAASSLSPWHSIPAKKPEGINCTTRVYSYGADSNRTKLVSRTPGTGGACDVASAGNTQSFSYDTADRLVGSGVTFLSPGPVLGGLCKYV